MRKAVVSFADGTGSYRKKLLRLEQSFKGNFDGDFLGFTDYKTIGSPTHSEIPYAFKPYAIQKAIDMGYELILYADSPIYAKQNIQPVFNYVEKHGYVFFDNIGFCLSDYTNDRMMEYFKISRNDGWKIPMIMACCFGLNTQSTEATEFFRQYKESVPVYGGEWNNDDLTESQDRRVKGSRHDQSAASCIIHNMGLEILKGQDTFFTYESHRQVMPIAESVCLYSG